MNETAVKIVQTNLKFCSQCEKEKPYVRIYVTGSIRCAKCGYFHYE